MAERVRTRLLGQVDEQRNPRTRATVDQLVDRYVEVIDVELCTRAGYVRYIDRHIRRQLGHFQVGRIVAEVLDSFFGRFRTCRDDCRGARSLDGPLERVRQDPVDLPDGRRGERLARVRRALDQAASRVDAVVVTVAAMLHDPALVVERGAVGHEKSLG